MRSIDVCVILTSDSAANMVTLVTLGHTRLTMGHTALTLGHTRLTMGHPVPAVTL